MGWSVEYGFVVVGSGAHLMRTNTKSVYNVRKGGSDPVLLSGRRPNEKRGSLPPFCRIRPRLDFCLWSAHLKLLV